MGVSQSDLLSGSAGSYLPVLKVSLYLLVAVVNQESTDSLQQASDAVVGSGISGFLGLGPNRGPPSNSSGLYQPTFQDSIFGQWLHIHPTALNFTFGMALQPPVAKPKNVSSPDAQVSLPSVNNAGTLHWLQTDTSFYNSYQVSWLTVDYSLVGSENGGTDPQDWLVSLDGWVAISGNSKIINQDKVTANVDPLYQGIYIPLDKARLLRMSVFPTSSSGVPDFARVTPCQMMVSPDRSPCQ